jgi:hypothetical protein
MPHPYDELEELATASVTCIRCGVLSAPYPLSVCRPCYDAARGTGRFGWKRSLEAL